MGEDDRRRDERGAPAPDAHPQGRGVGGLRMRLQTIMSSAEHIYSIADNHAQTVQVCIDRLHILGANEQLRVLTGRLQKSAVRANPGKMMRADRARSHGSARSS